LTPINGVARRQRGAAAAADTGLVHAPSADSTQGSPLAGRRIAFLLADGYEAAEYTGPRRFLVGLGAHATLVAPKPRGSRLQGYTHGLPAHSEAVELEVRHARVADFDALVVPGGVGSPDRLRLSHDAIAFIRGFAHAMKPIAAICHGPWPLIDAGVVAGKRMTSWPSLRADLLNAGAHWSDEPVVVDGLLVTSRRPDDLPAFQRALVELLTQPAAAAG
jgi:protease I